MEIRNMNDLREALAPYITEAMDKTRQYIGDNIYKVIDAYYAEKVFEHHGEKTNIPKEYHRTNRLHDSFERSFKRGIVRRIRNTWQFTVGWPDSYLNFQYKYPSGEQVLTWFNSASHGGNVEGEHMFWNEALSNMGEEQGIKNKFIEELKTAGVPIS